MSDNRSVAQLAVSLTAALGLVVVCVCSFVWGDREAEMLTVGSLCTLAGSSGAWLFPRNGNGYPKPTEQK